VAEKYVKKDPLVKFTFLEEDNTTRVDVNQWHAEVRGREKKIGKPSLPGDRIIFEVPKAFRKVKTVDKIILLHRKEKEDKLAMRSVRPIPDGSGKKGAVYQWDYQPCFHAVRCRITGTKKWITWKGPHGPTKMGAPLAYRDPPEDDRRYAEPREAGNPDYDTLPDAALYLGEKACDIFMVENVSKKSKHARCRVHGLIVQYRPFRAPVDRNFDTVHVFTNGTTFAEPEWDIMVPHFGGGQDQSVSEVKEYNGIYPGSKEIKAGADLNERINPWLTVNNGGLIIRLRGGKLWAGCEVAIGDRQLDPAKTVEQQVDQDGQVGIPGKALAFAYLRSRHNLNHKSFLVRKYPMGTASVLAIGPGRWKDINTPPSTHRNPFHSSFIRLDTRRDSAYIMAVRCRYYKDDTIFFRPLGPPVPYNATLAGDIKPQPK